MTLNKDELCYIKGPFNSVREDHDYIQLNACLKIVDDNNINSAFDSLPYNTIYDAYNDFGGNILPINVKIIMLFTVLHIVFF